MILLFELRNIQEIGDNGDNQNNASVRPKFGNNPIFYTNNSVRFLEVK